MLAVQLGGLTSVRKAFRISFAIRPLQSTNVFTVSNPAKTKGSAVLSTLYLTLCSGAPHFTTSKRDLFLSSMKRGRIGRSSMGGVLHHKAKRKFTRISFLKTAKQHCHSH